MTMTRSLQVWLVLLALLCPLCVMGQTSTPTVLRFTGGELTYTNANTYAQTIVRVVVSTTTSVTNTVTFSYSQGLQWTTGRVVSSTSFRTAYWPASTGSVATILYTGDKIRISQTYTGVTFATMDVIRGVGGGGDSGSNVLVVSGGATLYTGDRDDGEAIVWDAASNRYEHAAVPTVITSYVYGIDYPKLALVTYQRTSYYAKAYIDADLFAPNVPTNAFPVPGTHPEWWGVFLPPGHDGTGSAGPAGEDGIDGIGNLFFGPWSASFYYATNLYTNIVVSRLGKWYRAIGTSSNAAPESNTNVWEISIDPGTSATVFPTNLMWRGWYNAATTYASNDSVTVTSGLWAVTGTNSVTGVAPPTSYTGTSAVWTIVVPSIQGPQGTTGAQGPAGQDSIVSNIVQYTVYLGSNTVFANSPSPTNPWLQYISTTNGTNTYAWTDLPASITNRTLVQAGTLRATSFFLSGTNVYTDDGTNLLRNGVLISGSGGGSGTLTNIVVGGGSSSLLVVSNGAGQNVTLHLSTLVATNDSWDADIAAVVSSLNTVSQWVDNVFVQLTGETNAVNLTNATVLAKTPSSASEVATKGYVDNAGSAYVTNAISTVQINGTNYTGVSKLEWTDQGITNSTQEGSTVRVFRAYSEPVRAAAWRQGTNQFAAGVYTILPLTNTSNSTVYDVATGAWTWGRTGTATYVVSYRVEGTTGNEVYWIITRNTTDNAGTNRASTAVLYMPSSSATVVQNVTLSHNVDNPSDAFYVQRYEGAARPSGAGTTNVLGIAQDKKVEGTCE